MAVYEPVAYLSLLYGVSRLAAVRGNGQQRFVLDVVFLVWVLCSIVREALDQLGYYQHIPVAYMFVDIFAALWLAQKVRGRVSGIAETWFLGMILFNFVIWSRDEVNSWAHWIGGAALSVGQIVHIAGGIMRHELGGMAARAASRLHLRRPLAVDKDQAGDGR